jgi:hypothetical protein
VVRVAIGPLDVHLCGLRFSPDFPQKGVVTAIMAGTRRRISTGSMIRSAAV